MKKGEMGMPRALNEPEILEFLRTNNNVYEKKVTLTEMINFINDLCETDDEIVNKYKAGINRMLEQPGTKLNIQGNIALKNDGKALYDVIEKVHNKMDKNITVQNERGQYVKNYEQVVNEKKAYHREIDNVNIDQDRLEMNNFKELKNQN